MLSIFSASMLIVGGHVASSFAHPTLLKAFPAKKSSRLKSLKLIRKGSIPELSQKAIFGLLRQFGYRSLILFLFSFSLFGATPPSPLVTTVWDVLRGEFALNHAINQPEVQAQLNWFLSHPAYLQKLAQARPYIYHIVTSIKERGLPGELALLPMIESAFDPFAYSTVGAAGLWQLMPNTGIYWGLRQDWWFDARRSISSSTDAALNYLSYLNRYFNGNWILAIAAYDAGEGAVSRAIKAQAPSRSKQGFWTLPLPTETKIYVPRLLALAEIIQYPEHYQVSLPEIPHIPYFEEVNIGSQIDLNHAAKLAGISYKELIKLNPGYNHWTTAPDQPFKLLIPRDRVLYFSRNLANLPREKRVSLVQHLVQQGETLNTIAQRYFTTVKLIRNLNQLTKNQLRVGQYLLIPSTKNTPLPLVQKPASLEEKNKPLTLKIYKVIHIVQPGDSYQSLERKYKVTALNIQAWNKLNAQSALQIGILLIIWRRA